MSADPSNVAFLADAYRHRERSLYAQLVVEHRHQDYSSEECRLALAQVVIEVEAAIIAIEARLGLSPDPEAARYEALLELDDDGLDELLRGGFLDDLLNDGGE